MATKDKTKDKTKRRKRKVDSDRTMTSLLDAATKLFLEKGFEATSIGDICSAAKLTKPTAYYYFESKNHLLFSVHIRGLEKNLKPYMEMVKAIPEPEARCRTMIREYTRVICSERALRFLLHGTLTIKDKFSKEIRQAWKEHYHLLRDTIAEIQSKGVFVDDVSPSFAALLILGMITWITFWYDFGKTGSGRSSALSGAFGNHEADKIDELADLVERLVFHGLSRHG